MKSASAPTTPALAQGLASAASGKAQVQAAAANVAKPQQLAALTGPKQQPAQQQQQPAPPFIVQPRTLEDEVPIAPR